MTTTRRQFALLAWFGLLLVASCFRRSAYDCSLNTDCRQGETCEARRCVSLVDGGATVVADASLDDASFVDASGVDASGVDANANDTGVAGDSDAGALNDTGSDFDDAALPDATDGDSGPAASDSGTMVDPNGFGADCHIECPSPLLPSTTFEYNFAGGPAELAAQWVEVNKIMTILVPGADPYLQTQGPMNSYLQTTQTIVPQPSDFVARMKIRLTVSVMSSATFRLGSQNCHDFTFARMMSSEQMYVNSLNPRMLSGLGVWRCLQIGVKSSMPGTITYSIDGTVPTRVGCGLTSTFIELRPHDSTLVDWDAIKIMKCQ